MDNDERLAIVIPAYNEEATVGAVVRDCLAARPGAEVCVVSDGSADATVARAREAGATVVALPCNLGVGPAVQAGLQWARDRGFGLVVRLDADGQHPPAEIAKLLSRMEETGADFVVGSRFLPGSSFESGSTPARRLGNRALARFLSIICRCPVTDPSSGLWCARGALVRYFAHRYPAEYPEPEAMALLRRQGYSMAEAPVRVLPRQAGVSHLRSLGVAYYALRVGLALLADRVRPVDPRFAKRRGAAS
jgi:glycosyltransferase involved in cell wall biosynthesis